MKTFVNFMRSLFDSNTDKDKVRNIEDTPESEREHIKSCKHCHGTGDIMLTNLDGSVTGQAFGDCGCWKENIVQEDGKS
jgi:hypothetical protein